MADAGDEKPAPLVSGEKTMGDASGPRTVTEEIPLVGPEEVAENAGTADTADTNGQVEAEKTEGSATTDSNAQTTTDTEVKVTSDEPSNDTQSAASAPSKPSSVAVHEDAPNSSQAPGPVADTQQQFTLDTSVETRSTASGGQPAQSNNVTGVAAVPSGGAEEKKEQELKVGKNEGDVVLTVPASPVHMSAQSSQHSDVGSDENDNAKAEGEDSPLVDEEGKPELVSTARLFQYADGFDRLLMFLGCLFGAGHGVFLPVMMLIFGETVSLLAGTRLPPVNVTGNINSTLPTMATTAAANVTFVNPLDSLVEDMGRLAIIYCALAGGVLVVTYIQIFAWSSVGERLTRRIRRLFFSAVLNQDVSWFDTHKTGELSSRMSDDLVKVYGGIGDKNGLFFQWIATNISGLIIGFVKGWKLTLIVLFGGGPFLIASGVFVSKLMANVGSKEQNSYAKAGAVAGEVLSSIRTVVAFGGEKQEAERYEKELETARLFAVRKGFISGFGFAVVYLMMFGTYGLAFYTGTLFVWEGDFEPGDMVATFFNVVIACFALGHAAPSMQANAEARGAAVAVYNIIDSVPTINTASGKGKKPEKLDGNMTLENVHFAYPARRDVQILNGLNLEIKKGQTTALVGPSGCGKSTIIQLVQRFYDVDAGSVTLDGNDVRELNVQWLRSQIGIVGQEPVLFATTIAENIAYGSLKTVSREEVVAAAKQANAHDFISALPEGYETLVGERGAQMSGGQKQRIAIARALIRNPRILLLDEATSALDTESERIVQASLEAASEGRTTIVIAHRLTTVRNADTIIALKDGVVEEIGNHKTLMEKEGLYHALVRMQGAVTVDPEEEDTSEKVKVEKKASLEKKLSTGSAKRQISSKTDGDMANEDEDEEEEDDDDLPPVDSKRVIMYNKPEFPTMALGAFCALAFGTVFPLFGIIFAEVLSVFELLNDRANEKEYFRRAHLWSGMFGVLGVAAFIVLLSQSYFFGRSGAALTKRMRSIAFRAILRQNIGFFDDKANSTGALTTRLSADAALIQGASGQKIGQIFQVISTLVTALTIGFFSSWQMTLVIMGTLPLLVAAGAANTKALAGHGTTRKSEYQEAGKAAVEVIDNVRTVVALGLEERSVDRYMAILDPVYHKHKRARHYQALATGMSEATFFFVYAICFAFGAFLIENGHSTFTDVFTVFGSMVFGAFSLGQASAFAPDIAKAGGASARIFKLLDKKPEIDSYSEEGEQPSGVKGDIQLKDIKFRYPTRPDVQILNGTTITAKAGQTIALVGQSGCGKSTSVGLLERFYDPEGGTVYIDGKDIKSLNLAWWRRQVGIVQQEPILFDASIGDNIAYGALERMVTIEEIQQVAKKANIHDFIATLPKGYDTNVGAKGTQLSGGQKQRIAIARALVRNPKVLLLDEATSALDTESERVVQEALDAAREGRTSVVIAHRLSTIHNSDKIIVLGGGKVIEEGTHAELMAAKGAYCKLNTAQESNKGATLA